MLVPIDVYSPNRYNYLFGAPNSRSEGFIMAILKMAAATREETGSRASRKLRKEGFIPASLYAGGENPTLLKIESNKWGKFLTDQLNLVNIQFQDGGEQVAAVREIQRDPLTQGTIHVDFYRVRMDQLTEFHVAIRFEGIPVGVTDGGVRTVTSEYVAVECLPTDVPDEIPLDISQLEIGHALNAGDIILPQGLKLVSDPGMTIISITTIRVVEEEEPEEEEAVEEGAEGEEKPAEGEEKPAEGEDKVREKGYKKKEEKSHK